MKKYILWVRINQTQTANTIVYAEGQYQAKHLGEMQYGVGGSSYLLEPGDSLQFDGEAPHGPRTLITMPVQFLSVKAYGHGNR